MIFSIWCSCAMSVMWCAPILWLSQHKIQWAWHRKLWVRFSVFYPWRDTRDPLTPFWTVFWAFLHSNEKRLLAEAVSRCRLSELILQMTNVRLKRRGGRVHLDQCLNSLTPSAWVRKKSALHLVFTGDSEKLKIIAAQHQFETRLAVWWRNHLTW